MLREQTLRAENELARCKEEFNMLELRVNAQIMLLLQLINPFTDADLLKTTQIKLAATELDELVQSMPAIKNKIRTLEHELGK